MTAVLGRLQLLNGFCNANASHFTNDGINTIELNRREGVVHMSDRGNIADSVAWATDILDQPTIRISVSGTYRHVEVVGKWLGLQVAVKACTNSDNDKLRIDLHIDWNSGNVHGETVTPEKLREIAAEVIA